MKRVVMTLATGLVGVAIGIAMSGPPAYAAGRTKVDCDAVMSELNSGKKAKEVASDLKISKSSVYKCKKKAATSAASSAATPAAPAPK